MDKTSKLLIVLILALLGLQTMGEETMAEKATAKTHDAKRASKKAWHRTKEAVCMKGDTKCEAEKMKDRMHEGADTVKDKASEAKNAVDSDHK